MTRSLFTTTTFLKSMLLASLLGFTACSKMHTTADETINAPSNEETQGIIGGDAVATSEDIAKTTVQIFTFQTYRDQTGRLGISGVSGCTGSLLANDIVLTAAHCTTENPYYIILYFSTDAPKSMQELIASVGTNPLIRRVVGGKVAGAWSKLTEDQKADWGDIALLKFEGGLPEGYELAKLLPNNVALKANQTVTLAGFGMTDGVKKSSSDRLLKVDIPILNPTFSKSEMVVDSGKKGPCHGDSGGPAYVMVKGKRYVAGTTSRAESQTDPMGLCIGDTVYTKTQAYNPWIKSMMTVLQSPTYKAEAIPQPQ